MAIWIIYWTVSLDTSRQSLLIYQHPRSSSRSPPRFIGNAYSRHAGHPLTPGLSTFVVNPHRFLARGNVEKCIPLSSIPLSHPHALWLVSRRIAPMKRIFINPRRPSIAFTPRFSLAPSRPVFEIRDMISARVLHGDFESWLSFPARERSRAKAIDRRQRKAARRIQRMIIDRVSSTFGDPHIERMRGSVTRPRISASRTLVQPSARMVLHDGRHRGSTRDAYCS